MQDRAMMGSWAEGREGEYGTSRIPGWELWLNQPQEAALLGSRPSISSAHAGYDITLRNLLQVLGEDGDSEEDHVKEKLKLVQDFLHVDAQDQLTSLEDKMNKSEISMEIYISKVKALLGKELHLEKGSHVDDVEQNGKTNGSSNGSQKDENTEDVTMDVQEEEEAVKSPTASKGKGGRKSKANSDTKKSPASSRVTRNSGKQPTILSMFSKVCVYDFLYCLVLCSQLQQV
ncbi:hypothetical protein F7725_003269 [Dissostichus mawsoni]|uniref:DMAP1-binding domain-containing protein n=1 Tax=Dissostichus mawsoni TaxID=36200 RepID=A0A7J5YB49_DISMA|nr:hypothetical protein F7725_003269 [Dissostichus mawsoni]